MRLEPGQAAVVTGAAGGIGLGLAQAFAARGLQVVLADRDADRVEAAAAALRADGAVALAVPTDVTDLAQVQHLAAVTLERCGRVDVLCNNAGVSVPPAPSWEHPPALWRWVHEVCVMGTVHGLHAFVGQLVAQGSGHVLNTASVAGLTPLPTKAPYGVAKQAIVALSETLLEELREPAPGVGVSVLCPALVDTELSANSAAAGHASLGLRAEDFPPSMHTMTGLHGTVLTAADVARLALEGIEADRLHIVTHADSVLPVRRRIAGVLDDLPTA